MRSPSAGARHVRRICGITAIAILIVGAGQAPLRVQDSPSDFTHFESAHVHPAAMTPDGNYLAVVNTPDGRLAIFDLNGTQPVRVADIAVGLEPVSVAALSNSTVWVVNHLSDDVSVVDLATRHVRATLRVGNEPSDIVFAGTPTRAYVSVSMEDVVKVFDPNNLAAPPTVIVVAGHLPGSLGRNAAGTRVYVASLQAGNRTSVLSTAEALGSLPPPSPPMAGGLPPAPDVGLIVQQQANGDWRDESGHNWNPAIGYTVPDADLIEIDTGSLAILRTLGGLGTLNYGIAVSPVNGTVALVATEARNLLRFAPNLTGHVVDTQISFVPTTGSTTTRSLNPHVNYSVPTGPASERDSSLATPTGLAWSTNGQRIYATFLGSDRIAILDPTGGANTTVLARRPTVAGPTAVVVDDARNRLYVIGRFHDQLQTLSTSNLSPIASTRIGYDPTPDAIVNGRKFLYGASVSGHGDQACASCHAFGDVDGLAWDLGNPAGAFAPAPAAELDPFLEGLHPMKGPMVTPTLRGTSQRRRFLWRGERPDLSACDPEFAALLGAQAARPDSEVTALGAFLTPLAHRPNRTRNLDGSLPDAPSNQASAMRGLTVFTTTTVDGVRRCADCHAGVDGGRARMIGGPELGSDQDMTIPPLRTLHRKVGFIDQASAISPRGFGYLHDGSTDMLTHLLNAFPTGLGAAQSRADLVAYLMAFDTGTPTVIGRQITFDGTNNADGPTIARLDTLRGRSAAGDCDVIATGRVGNLPRSWLYAGTGSWTPDRVSEVAVSTTALIATATASTALTVTAVTVGSGLRMALDRDRDTYLGGDELDAGSDPGDPSSTPLNVSVAVGERMARAPWLLPNPFRDVLEVRLTIARPSLVTVAVFDPLGRRVRTLARDRSFAAGQHAIAWDGARADGSSVSPGMYFIRIQSGGHTWNRVAVRLK